MKAIITGASSGIGRDMARILSDKGYDLVLVARRKTRLEQLKKQLKTKVEIVDLDLSSTFNCLKLHNMYKNDSEVEILINNAGFGLFGNFIDISLDKELDMIDLNIKTVHTLTKLFLQTFEENKNGYILNVSSVAAFSPGPKMATYYATKAYVLRLTEAIHEELKRTNSNVYIGALCPGPTTTEFNKVAKVKFDLKSQSSYDVAEYGIKKMFKRKMVIKPNIAVKMAAFFQRFCPTSLLLKISYNIQHKKEK